MRGTVMLLSVLIVFIISGCSKSDQYYWDKLQNTVSAMMSGGPSCDDDRVLDHIYTFWVVGWRRSGTAYIADPLPPGHLNPRLLRGFQDKKVWSVDVLPGSISRADPESIVMTRNDTAIRRIECFARVEFSVRDGSKWGDQRKKVREFVYSAQYDELGNLLVWTERPIWEGKKVTYLISACKVDGQGRMECPDVSRFDLLLQDIEYPW